MQRHYREKLSDLDNKIATLYHAASSDVLELMALEDALQRDTDMFLSQKKMGRVRIYDKWGLKTGERILELKNAEFEQMPSLGIF